MTLSLSVLRLRRAGGQLLHRPEELDAAGVVGALLAVQAQDLRAARLAVRARAPGLTAADVDAAFGEERSLVSTWLMRGTLHLVAREDYPWLLALTAPTRLANNTRRLGQEGVSPDDADRALAVISRALADEGPLTRQALAERIAAHGIRAEGQAVPHILMLAALRGAIVLGPEAGGAFALTRDWLGEPHAPPLRDSALAELARRYLTAHGPATEADLAGWAGLPLRDVRTGLREIDLEHLGGGMLDLAGRAGPPEQIAPRLLPAFDPYMLGWKDRSFAVPASHARRVHPGGGILRPVATVDGRVVGTWTAQRRSGRLAVEIEPFTRVTGDEAEALRADAEDVARFEGLNSRSPKTELGKDAGRP